MTQSKEVVLTFFAKVTDAAGVMAQAESVQGSPVGDIKEALCFALVNPNRAPLDVGYEIMSKDAYLLADSFFMIVVKCSVIHEHLLNAEAEECYETVWQEHGWTPADLTTALWEVLVASSAGPAFNAIGVEVQEHRLREGAKPLSSQNGEHLKRGMIFWTVAGELVRLFGRAAGDANQWLVEDWDGEWSIYGSTVDLVDLAILVSPEVATSDTATVDAVFFDIKDVAPADLRLDYHASEKHISLELHHAADFEDGTAGERMEVHRVLFIDTINTNHHDAAEELAIALCATVNEQPYLMAKVKALAMAALPVVAAN